MKMKNIQTEATLEPSTVMEKSDNKEIIEVESPRPTVQEWSHTSWNPYTGCTRTSPGCAHCWADRMTQRLWKGKPGYPKDNPFNLAFHPDRMDRNYARHPAREREPQRILVCSMSDLFHDGIPFEHVEMIFNELAEIDHHNYLVLTKRSERMMELASRLPWPDHICASVSLENADYVYRIDHLRKTPAAVKILFVEPLLGPLPHLNLGGIHQVVVGGESGPGARPMEPDWVRDIRDQCIDAGVPFFFKQWGGGIRSLRGHELDGRTWSEWPDKMKVID